MLAGPANHRNLTGNGRSFDNLDWFLADALGIKSIDLNRSFQRLRKQRNIRNFARWITIENRPEMDSLAGFESVYLHPEDPRQIERTLAV